MRVMVSLVSLTGLLNRTAMWHATSERLGETTKTTIRYDNMQIAKISKEWQPIRNSHKPSRNSIFNSWIPDGYPKGFDINMPMCHSLTLRWQRSALRLRPEPTSRYENDIVRCWVVDSLTHPRDRVLGTRLSRSHSLRSQHSLSISDSSLVRVYYA